jgi:hypothetical protein
MGEFYYQTISRFGYREEADKIRDAWRSGDRDQARREVTDEMLDAFAVCGSRDDAAWALERFYEAGVDTPIGAIPSKAPDRLVRTTIEQFSRL